MRVVALTLAMSSLLVACGADPASVSTLASRLGVTNELDTRAPDADTNTIAGLVAGCGDAPPETLPPLPTTTAALPAACDERARIAAVVAQCGPLSAAQTVDDDDNLGDAIDACGDGTCHLVLSAGRFQGELSVGCVVIEGAGRSTVIDGALSFTAPAVLARVLVQDDYGAISATSDLLVNEAVVIGGYEGFGAAWDQEIDVAICRSQIAAGYSGIGLSWGTRRLTVAGNGIASCYEGVGASWGSSGVVVTQNVIAAAYSAVSIHQSREIAVLGNVLFAEYEAVGITSWDPYQPDDPYDVPVRDVLVRGNDVRRGALPASDPAVDILIDQ